MSSGGDLASYSWGVTNTSPAPQLQLPAVQHTGGANIIAVLIGM